MKRMLVFITGAIALLAAPLPTSAATGATSERHPAKDAQANRPAGTHDATPDPRNVNHLGSHWTAPGRSADLPTFGFISNGTLRLGINPEGHIDATSGTEDLGLEFIPTSGDALIPGCWCEGWGLADVRNSISGYASVDNGGVSSNVTVTTFDVTADSAESVVEIDGRLRVRHFYHPSSESNLYKVDVTVTNIGGDEASLVYRRDMDWDVPPTEFDEFVTLQGSAPYLLDSTDDGFAFVDPLEPLTDLGERGTFLDAGPDDRGGAFDVSLGNLAPGDATNLTLFYGAAATEGDALAALQSVQAQVYSLGEPNTADGARLGTPNTFMFGIKGTCDGDADCDYLSDADEAAVGTNPNDQDTDHDGLLDPWEVPSSVPGAGFHSPDFLHTPTVDEVFGPFNPGSCPLPGSDLRLDGQVTCFNDPPDPLHRDVFLEIDWQDCRLGSCPEILGLHVDPLHHAPNLPALGEVTDVFADAPISNPDGMFGVNLHVLIDEVIPHTPNCDQDESAVRPQYFGTLAQRTGLNSSEIMEAKRLAVRYVWSGHSSRSSSGAQCPNPDGPTFFFQGFGFTQLADYDWGPFGDVDVGGQDVLVTLGPIWSCSSQIKLNKDSPFLGPCYRQVKIIQTWDPFGGIGSAVVPIPGIFPAKVKDQFGNEKTVRWPVNQLLGLGESAGITQLWARSLTHLLGHALGIPDEFTVGNKPDVPGVDSDGDGRRDSPDAPEPYLSWEGLNYAPGGGFATLQEAFPDYDTLASQDLDGDGVPEGEDNCAGIFNPKDGDRQPDRDFDDFGDACDFDLDGDGMGNPATRGPGRGGGASDAGTGTTPQGEIVAASDPYPADTDNDGVDNDADADDDNDGVADTVDRCVIVADPAQLDADGDGAGDVCDLDDDDDGYPDGLEAAVGSDPIDAASTAEVLGQGTECSDGVDNDLDGGTDGADGGCVDSDGDSMPDALDNCPAVANAANAFADGDGDGIGDACDAAVDAATVTIDAVTDPEVDETDLGTAVAWHADKDGSYVVLLGGADCTEGLQVDAGAYSRPVSLAASIPAALLAEGTNVVRVCLTTSAGTFSAVATVEKNTGGQLFDFSGFFPPVDNVPVLNVMRAGAAVPVKFSLNGDQGLDILAPGSPSSQLMNCQTGEGLDRIEETVQSGESELQYDPATDEYTYVWKTSRSWAGTCRKFSLELTDGSVHEAYFEFKR